MRAGDTIAWLVPARCTWQCSGAAQLLAAKHAWTPTAPVSPPGRWPGGLGMAGLPAGCRGLPGGCRRFSSSETRPTRLRMEGPSAGGGGAEGRWTDSARPRRATGACKPVMGSGQDRARPTLPSIPGVTPATGSGAVGATQPRRDPGADHHPDRGGPPRTPSRAHRVGDHRTAPRPLRRHARIPTVAVELVERIRRRSPTSDCLSATTVGAEPVERGPRCRERLRAWHAPRPVAATGRPEADHVGGRGPRRKRRNRR